MPELERHLVRRLQFCWRLGVRAFRRTGAGDFVNSLGATPPEELYILYRVAKARLDALGAEVGPLVGRYATLMEMAGVSFTLIGLDGELEGFLKAPSDCAFWSVR